MLTTDRLKHRLFTALDLDRLVELRAKSAVAKHLGGAKATTRSWIQKRLEYYLSCYQIFGFGVQAIILQETDEIIGWSGLQPVENSPEIQLTYGLGEAYWRQGFGYETAFAWLKVGFKTLELEQIIALTAPENTGSWTLMEKLGMRFECTQEGYGITCKRYAISMAEFEASLKGWR